MTAWFDVLPSEGQAAVIGLEAENARLRERVAALEAACYEEVPDGGPHAFSGFVCRLCGWDCSPEFRAEHEPSCVLYEADERGAE